MTRSIHWKEIEGEIITEPVLIDGEDYVFKLKSQGRVYKIFLKVNKKRYLKVGTRVIITGLPLGDKMLGYHCKPVRTPIRDL